ncbi:hypothetical protein GGR56DRAFT_640474 [Xylariaceae sp. FL0804]|nr:hypothetical protein GGR56DRAFT_640474 [Xylariaceae sp. FL0804]
MRLLSAWVGIFPPSSASCFGWHAVLATYYLPYTRFSQTKLESPTVLLLLLYLGTCVPNPYTKTTTITAVSPVGYSVGKPPSVLRIVPRDSILVRSRAPRHGHISVFPSLQI